MLAARQADLGPLPGLVGFSPGDAQPQTAADAGDILDLQGDEFGAAQRAGEAEQEEQTVASAAGEASQVATSWRSMSSDSAAAFSTGRPCRRSKACSGAWMSRCPGFQARSLKRCALPIADRRRRIVVGAWLSARLVR